MARSIQGKELGKVHYPIFCPCPYDLKENYNTHSGKSQIKLSTVVSFCHRLYRNVNVLIYLKYVPTKRTIPFSIATPWALIKVGVAYYYFKGSITTTALYIIILGRTFDLMRNKSKTLIALPTNSRILRTTCLTDTFFSRIFKKNKVNYPDNERDYC